MTPILTPKITRVGPHYSFTPGRITLVSGAEYGTELPPGIYNGTMTNQGPMLMPHAPKMDDLRLFKSDTVVQTLLDEVQKFWGIRERFASRGLVHKKGIGLWGPPGTGKSAVQILMAMQAVHLGHVCLRLSDGGVDLQCIEMIRRVEPERPLICLIEDIDDYDDHEFLPLLDGADQHGNMVFVATSNYPENLSERLLDRPSRFDMWVHIGPPKPDVRAEYIRATEPSFTEREVEQIVAKTSGYSLAHLREIVVLAKCYEYPIATAIDRLNKHKCQAAQFAEAKKLAEKEARR